MKKTNIVTLIIITLNVFAWLINIVSGGGSVLGLALFGGGYFKEFGEAAYPLIFVQGEWWRLLLCGYLHIGIFHLVFNVYALIIVGTKIEERLGKISSFVYYHLGIMVTIAIWCLLIKQDSMVGASLGIYVWLGILFGLYKLDKANQGFQEMTSQRRYIICYIVIGCFFGIDTIIVHLIGWIVGMLFGGMYIYWKKVLTKRDN